MKGTVVDDNGETIIGASVVVKGNNSIGTISDIDLHFVLTVPNEKSVLVVSFVGMEPQEVKASSKGTIKVVLKDDTQLLDEVVVVGYGQQKRKRRWWWSHYTDFRKNTRAVWGKQFRGAALTVTFRESLLPVLPVCPVPKTEEDYYPHTELVE